MTAPDLLFDLDGTLIESRPGVVDGFHHAMTEMGEPLDAAFPLDFAIGPPLSESFGRLLRSPTPERVAMAVRAYRARYAEVAVSGSALFPGIAEMLATLAARGRRMFVATSKQEGFARQILRHFEVADRFEVIHGESMDGRRATKRAVIDHLIAAHGVTPSNAIMIGDRAQDVEAGAAAGLATIGVRWGYAAPGELETAGANRIVDTPEALPAIV